MKLNFHMEPARIYGLIVAVVGLGWACLAWAGIDVPTAVQLAADGVLAALIGTSGDLKKVPILNQIPGIKSLPPLGLRGHVSPAVSKGHPIGNLPGQQGE